MASIRLAPAKLANELQDGLAGRVDRARGELVQRVTRLLPARVVEVDEVDRGNAAPGERRVVVEDDAALGAREHPRRAHAPRRRPQLRPQRGVAALLARDAEVLLA